MELTLPNSMTTSIEVGMKWRQVFGTLPTPAKYRLKLKAHFARMKRLAMNAYKRVKDRTYDLKCLKRELKSMAFLLFMASIVVNRAGIIISI